MIGIGVCVKKMDNDRLAALIQQPVRRSLHILFPERCHNPALCIHTFFDFKSQVARYDRCEFSPHAVGVRPGPASEFQYIPKALGRDQPRAA